MEKRGYRENLDMLAEMFPGKAAISPKEAAGVLGASVDTVYAAMKKVYQPLPYNKLSKKKIVIPIPGLARWLCGR